MSSNNPDSKPERPASLPKYVVEPVERQEAVVLRRIIAYASELAELTPKHPVMTDDFDSGSLQPGDIMRHSSSKSTVRDNTGQVARILGNEGVEFWDSDGKIKTVKLDTVQAVSTDSTNQGLLDKIMHQGDTDVGVEQSNNEGERTNLALDTDQKEKEIEPPEGVPKTLLKGMQRQDDESLIDLISYAKSLIEQIEKPPDDLTDEGEELVGAEDVEGRENWTRVIKRIPCGKQCNGCPHGPYLYLVRRVTVDRLEWRYIGAVSGDDLKDDEEYPDQKDEDKEDDEEKNQIDPNVLMDEPEYPDQDDGDGENNDSEKDWEEQEDDIGDYVTEEDGTI